MSTTTITIWYSLLNKAAMKISSNSQSYLNTVEVITITFSLNRSELKRSTTIDMLQAWQQQVTTISQIACLSSLRGRAVAFITIWDVVTSQFRMIKLRISLTTAISMPFTGRHRIVWVIQGWERMGKLIFRITLTNKKECESALTTFRTLQWVSHIPFSIRKQPINDKTSSNSRMAST